MDRARKRELRSLNNRAWSGDADVFTTNPSLDSSLKKNTAFIKRLRTAISSNGLDTFIQEIKSLSLHKYLSELTSASYEGLCKLKTSVEIAAGVEIISALHQRFGPGEFTGKLGWHVGRGLATPDKAQLKMLSAESREKEEKERMTRHKLLIRVATELWLVGVLRSLDDIVRPDDASASKGKENVSSTPSKLNEAVSKRSVPQSSKSAASPANAAAVATAAGSVGEPFPLEVLKDMLGHDREHVNLPLVVLFVKSFGWDILGIKPAKTEETKDGKGDEAAMPLIDDVPDSYDQSSAEEDDQAESESDASAFITPALQQRFRNILNRYFQDVKSHIIRDHQSIIAQSRRNAEAYIKSGEIFEDRQANFEKQQKAQERLISNAQILCDALQGQDMPVLKDAEDSQSMASSGIGLVKTADYLRAATEGQGIWDDEEERRLYESLVDLRDRVPMILLEEVKRKKPDEEPQVGKRATQMQSGSDEKQTTDTASATHDDQSTAIANKSVGVQVDALLARLPELQNKDQADQAAVDFAFLNSKASRNRLIKALQEVPKGRSDLLPFYSRIIATLGRYFPDISNSLVSYLDDEFRSLQRRKQKEFLGSVRINNMRYLAELTKFGVVPEHVIFHCFKVSLDEFSRMNIEIICSLLENCGRYLLRNPETASRTTSFLETLQRKKAAQHLGQQERMMIENAVYLVSPPERAAIEQKERSPVAMYVAQLVYVDMNKRTYAKILKSLRKLHWEEAEIVAILTSVFTKPWKVRYSNIYLLAILLSSLHRYHQDFAISCIDDLLEQITLGLEQNDFRFNQRRLAEMRYLGELYNYKMVDSPVIFDTMFRIVSFGHASGTPLVNQMNGLDLPDDFFRIRLICAILDTCGVCFDRGASRKKLDFFLTYFQYYVRTKDSLPMDIDFLLRDTFAMVRPQWKILTNFEEAGEAFAQAVKEHYKAAEIEKLVEFEDTDDKSSEDEEGDDEAGLPRSGAQSPISDGSIKDSGIDEPLQDTLDAEESIVVTRREQERDPEAEADFDRELQRLMSESLDSRKFERKPAFDLPLPLRKSVKLAAPEEEGSDAENAPVEPFPRSTVPFQLMTKKGSKAQTRSIDLPADSSFAIALKTQQEAERLEQQRIKNHILNLDLQDNPNEDSFGLGDKHQHNASLTSRHSSNNARLAADKSSSNRRGDRARKLQLSDVDWT